MPQQCYKVYEQLSNVKRHGVPQQCVQIPYSTSIH